MNQLSRLKDTAEALEKRKVLLESSCGTEKFNQIVTNTLDQLRVNTVTPAIAKDLMDFISEIYSLEHKFPQSKH